MSLFDTTEYTRPGTPAEPAEQLSYGRRLTLRWRADLDAGRHPVTRLPLLDPEWGFTCGTCAHLRYQPGVAGSYPKCALRHARSEATDLRLRWPACTRYRIEVA